MASGETATYDLPYPLSSDPVNVHGDLQDLAEAIDAILPTLGLPYHTIEIRNDSGSTISKGYPVYINGYSTTSAKPTIQVSNANTSSTFPTIGLVQANVTNGSDGTVVLSGVFSGINTSSFAAGDRLYTAAGGGLTNTKPASGGGVLGVVAKAATSGIIVVGANKGNGTWQALKDGLS